MILTGSAIRDAIASGEIVFDPFVDNAVNPNSLNYRLGDEIFRVRQKKGVENAEQVKMRPKRGRYLLRKGNLYLGHTLETIGSTVYVTSLIGRSSIGRLGLFVQVSANLGHVGAIHRWTLELVPVIDIYVYPGQTIGQVSFWRCFGDQEQYGGWFGRYDLPTPSKYHDPRFSQSELSNDSDRT